MERHCQLRKLSGMCQDFIQLFNPYKDSVPRELYVQLRSSNLEH